MKEFADQDGLVTKENFTNYAKNSKFFKSQINENNSNSVVARQLAIKKAEIAFRMFDKDGDGFLTKSEFSKICKKLNRQQVDAVFRKFDKDDDGLLSFEEFQTMFNRKWKINAKKWFYSNQKSIQIFVIEIKQIVKSTSCDSTGFASFFDNFSSLSERYIFPYCLPTYGEICTISNETPYRKNLLFRTKPHYV